MDAYIKLAKELAAMSVHLVELAEPIASTELRTVLMDCAVAAGTAARAILEHIEKDAQK